MTKEEIIKEWLENAYAKAAERTRYEATHLEDGTPLFKDNSSEEPTHSLN